MNGCSLTRWMGYNAPHRRLLYSMSVTPPDLASRGGRFFLGHRTLADLERDRQHPRPRCVTRLTYATLLVERR